MTTLANVHFFMPRTQPKEIDFITYCEKHQLNHMIQETTKHYIKKQINSSLAFNDFLQTYFRGETVLLRPFTQFSESKMNRLVFVQSFQKVLINLKQTFESFDDKSGFDYLQLVKLLCGDFPRDIVLSALSLTGTMDEETILRKQISLQQFSRALLFTLIFDDFIQELQKNNVQNVLKKYYMNDALSELMIPNQAAIFEGLIKFSSNCNKIMPLPIMVYTLDLMNLLDGQVNWVQFKQTLFQNNKIQTQLSRLLSMVEKGMSKQIELDDELKRRKK